MRLIEYMPEDLIVEILSRLPVKSLLKFRAVCKSWRDIVDNPQFIAKHYHTRAAIRKNVCALIKHEIFFYEQGEMDAKEYDYMVPFTYLERGMRFQVVAPCNGIFCLVLHAHNIVVWNPATKEVKALPSSDIQHQLSLPPNFLWTPDCIVGLSFDPKSNGYKVVRIWVLRYEFRVYEWRPRKEIYRNIVEVWTPTDRTWRQINKVPPVIVTQGEDSLNLKGKCYWRPGYFESQLVSFDTDKDVFQGIPLPNSKSIVITNTTTSWLGTAILNESIALINRLVQNEGVFEVWLLSEGLADKDVSWSKHATIKIPIPESLPWGFRKNGELIFVNGKTGNLTFLNVNTGQVVDTAITMYYTEQIYTYHESLVSLKAFNPVGYQQRSQQQRQGSKMPIDVIGSTRPDYE